MSKPGLFILGIIILTLTTVLIVFLFFNFSQTFFSGEYTRNFEKSIIQKKENLSKRTQTGLGNVSDIQDNPDRSDTNVSGTEPCLRTDYLKYFTYRQTSENWEKNNKFGLYVYAEDEDFMEFAQELVNSSGGDWGYVLIPYNVKDRDYAKWTRVFNQLKNKRLIPVIQLHDVDTESYEEQTVEAGEFLNSFIWPIKYRYISVYNEPNDSRFWYNRIDPEEYAKVLDYTIDKFKELNPDFKLLNGAFNSSAPSDIYHMDSFEYMRRMNLAVPGIFDKLDAWASHPYPQPNFSGSPYVSGRWSIRAYESELNYLKSYLDVKKDLPVFITETGWAHAEGENYNPSYLSVDTVAEYLEIAYEEVWNKDDRVRAVILFTIWYEPPFDHFAFINEDKVPYYHYEKLKEFDKISGDPPYLEVQKSVISDCEQP